MNIYEKQVKAIFNCFNTIEEMMWDYIPHRKTYSEEAIGFDEGRPVLVKWSQKNGLSLSIRENNGSLWSSCNIGGEVLLPLPNAFYLVEGWREILKEFLTETLYTEFDVSKESIENMLQYTKIFEEEDE